MLHFVFGFNPEKPFSFLIQIVSLCYYAPHVLEILRWLCIIPDDDIGIIIGKTPIEPKFVKYRFID
jgi:hypothetical protein